MLTTDQFLQTIEDHLKARGISAKAFGMEAVRDPNFVYDLRKRGRSPSLDVVNRVLEHIAAAQSGEAA